MPSQNNLLLEVHPSKLPLSVELREWMIKEDFKDLNQLLAFTTNELLNRQGFGYRHLRELYSFLEENGLNHLFKQS